MIHLPEDRAICEKLLSSAKARGDGVKPLPELVVETGQRFLDAPYGPATLEQEGPEELVDNLRAFDCVTFVENVIVLAGLIIAGRTGSRTIWPPWNQYVTAAATWTATRPPPLFHRLAVRQWTQGDRQ